MDNGEDGQSLHKKIVMMFSDFMTRITKYEELVTMGSNLLVRFQQTLGFISRPLIGKKSQLIDHIVKANETTRLLSYVETGCVNVYDTAQNVSQLNTCHLGLQDHVKQVKGVLDEIKCLLEAVAPVLQLWQEQDRDVIYTSDPVLDDNEQVSSPDPSKPAVLMAIIYSMLKQEYAMQDLIVSSLNLKSSPGELETYCKMWSLRPYIDDEIMDTAWSLIP